MRDVGYKKITVLTASIRGTQCGHYAVTRSLIAGFNQLGVCFNYNPLSIEKVGDVVVVLANPEALKQAINFKSQRRIKKLFVGPNLMTRADEYNGIMASPEVDVCIVPSDWVRIAYEEEVPSLKGRIKSWYAGVDATYWIAQDNDKQKSRQILVYWKTESESFCHAIEDILKKYGWEPVRIRYGSYNAGQYKDLLSKSRFMVVISVSESQGIFLAEAWSMDVPTIVWNPKKLSAHGREYSVVSACPYLTGDTGIDWQELSDFEHILQSMDERLKLFKPRNWVLEHMTDEISAQVLLNIINTCH